MENTLPLLRETKKKEREKFDVLRSGLFLLVLAASVSFFKFSLLPQGVLYLLESAVIALVFLVVLFNRIYWKIPNIPMTFSFPVALMFVSIFLSLFAAYYFHDQPILLTLWAQRYMFLYFVYFFLHVIKLSVKQVERLLLFVALAYVAVYFLQYAIYPLKIVNVRIDFDRGTVRIFIPGLAFMMIMFYRFLQEFYYRKSMKDILYVMLFFSILILLGSRAGISMTAFVVAIALIFGRQIKSKVVLYFLIIFAIGALYFAFQEIFDNLLNLSSQESETADDNVRVRSIEYFTTEFFPNTLAYITGNGMHHEASSYGLKVAYMAARYGYFQVDIGIIGEFSRYGSFLVIGGLMIFAKLIFYKYDSNYIYIRYFIISGSLALFLGMNFTSTYGIVSICILMYIVDCLKNEHKNEQKEKKALVHFNQFDQHK